MTSRFNLLISAFVGVLGVSKITVLFVVYSITSPLSDYQIRTYHIGDLCNMQHTQHLCLCTGLKDGKATMPNSEAKTLKQEYKQLKQSMRSKKYEIVNLKKKMHDMKAEKRQVHINF